MIEDNVILIEDDKDMRLACEQSLLLEGITSHCIDAVEKMPVFDAVLFNGVIVTDIRLPGADGISLLNKISKVDPELPVILITGHGDIETAVNTMRMGAYDFLQKPFTSERLVTIVRRALEKRRLAMEVRHLKRLLATSSGLENQIIGASKEIIKLRRMVQEVAPAPVNVLIEGETGTGKELIARCLHDLSRRKGPFVALNCGGLPETLFESEIFGHEAGAFSGASKLRVGKIEYANKGTLFLDEIESMPMAMQVKLLRVLQEHTVERLGSNRSIPSDFRVISATKSDLSKLASEGKFRSDLIFRLNVVCLPLPPLRARREDIPVLFSHFVSQEAMRLDREAPDIPDNLISELIRYDWPGNVRELRNYAERCVLGFPLDLSSSHHEVTRSLHSSVEIYERSLITDALRRCGGNISRASDVLGIAKTTLADKIRKYQIVVS